MQPLAANFTIDQELQIPCYWEFYSHSIVAGGFELIS